MAASISRVDGVTQHRRSLAPWLLSRLLEERAMARRRRPSIQVPDPTTVTETAIDAGVRAVEMTAALARGFARGAITAARAMSEGATQATEETTRATADTARDAGERAKRATARTTPRVRSTRRKTQGRRRRAA
jgi:hypothetical protein